MINIRLLFYYRSRHNLQHSFERKVVGFNESVDLERDDIVFFFYESNNALYCCGRAILMERVETDQSWPERNAFVQAWSYADTVVYSKPREVTQLLSRFPEAFPKALRTTERVTNTVLLREIQKCLDSASMVNNTHPQFRNLAEPIPHRTFFTLPQGRNIIDRFRNWLCDVDPVVNSTSLL